ncbi:MAG: glycosyltransferase [Verrucomicrobiota bacterium]
MSTLKMRKSKIVLVGPAYPYRGGIAHFGDSLSNHLTSMGHEVQISNFIRLYPKLIFPGTTQMEPDASQRLTQVFPAIDSLNPLTWLQTARAIAEYRPDVVLFQYWEPLLAPIFGQMAKLLRQRRVRIICIVHNALPHSDRPGSSLLGRYFLNSCDQLVALSQKVQTDITSKLQISCPVERLFHPIYEHFGASMEKVKACEALRIDSARPVVLFFGLIRKYKGLDILLKAFAKVTPALPETLLIVAGEFYEKKRKYEKLLEDCHLEDNVIFEDRYIPQEHVARYFSAADLVVLPYLSGTQSGVLSTAYHFEKPFVITNVNGLAEMALSDPGMQVNPGKVDELGTAILNFFVEQKEEASKKDLQGKKQLYSWRLFCEKLSQLIDMEMKNSLRSQ